MDDTIRVRGRLVLGDRVAMGSVTVEGAVIASVSTDDGPIDPHASLLAPGFVDVHVHGWGGHDAMGGIEALDGMARALLRHGVTSFLPTAVSAPLPALHRFASNVRSWIAAAPADGAEPLGFNLEGPFLADARRGAHDPTHLVDPADVSATDLEPLMDGLRLITIAPEIPGAIDLITTLVARGVVVSLGHSASTLAEASAGYAAGATSTTHLFNGMGGVDHRAPGLAVAALTTDGAWVELIADGHHVHPGLWPLIVRAKPEGRLMLISDASSLAGTEVGRARIGNLDVEVVAGRVMLAGTKTLAGSIIALDDAVRNLVAAGVPLPTAFAAASANPLRLLGVTDRGRLAAGQAADMVELDGDLRVRRVMRGGHWYQNGRRAAG